jgi:Uri superfamily endonuclease
MSATSNKGIYCLVIKLLRASDIKIGCLGVFRFPKGFYIYTGSAQNNMACRIRRHLRKKKKFHWHIDYLLGVGEVACVYKYSGEKRMECMINNKVGSLKNAVIPVKGFGSSDCICDSHLWFFQNDPGVRMSKLSMGDTCGRPEEAHIQSLRDF